MFQIKRNLVVVMFIVVLSVIYQCIGVTQIGANSGNGYINNLFYKDNILGNGYLNDGKHWYLFKDGHKQIGIQKWKGEYYYFDLDTGLRSDSVFRKQWGKTYYFNQKGIAVSGFQTISGRKYFFGADGSYFLRKNTWIIINGKKYYADSNGVLVSGVKKIENKSYFFDFDTSCLRTKRDYVLSQWGKWYLIDKNGIVQSGLQRWQGKDYYFDPITFLKVKNQIKNINSIEWRFDNQGVGHKKEDRQPLGDITFTELNKLRNKNGLNPLIWNKKLAELAQRRSEETNFNGIPANHWRTQGEVIGIGWKKGSKVISAWFNETNMLPKGTSAHRDWLLNPAATKVGFGYSGNVIVGRSK